MAVCARAANKEATMIGTNHRETLRAMGGGKDLASPFNEGFSFTPQEYAVLKKTHPQLFDSDPKRRLANWKTWADSSEGKAFRIR